MAIGPKSWPFAGSDGGGARAARLQRLITTCWHNSIDPHHYLPDPFARLPGHPPDRIDELPPFACLERQRSKTA